MTDLARVATLVVLWLLAWGEASLANLLSGVLVAGALVVAFPLRHGAHTHVFVRPAGVVRLLLHLCRQLVASNLLVAREILSRRSQVRTGVLAYPVQHESDQIVALMANVIALSPGTMTVEVTSDPRVIYVHFLLLEDVEEARRAVAHLEDVIAGALGPPTPSPAKERP